MQTKASHNPIDFQTIILTIAMATQSSITSTYRTKAHNTAVKGVENSFHLKGLAADLVPDNPATKANIQALCEIFNLQYVDEPGHVHIEVF